MAKRQTRRTTRATGSKKRQEQEPQSKGVVRDDARDEDLKRRFVDQTGIEARDLPGAEHGQNVVDPADEMQRIPPHLHGGEMPDASNYAEGGLRADRAFGGARRAGNRKRN